MSCCTRRSTAASRPRPRSGWRRCAAWSSPRCGPTRCCAASAATCAPSMSLCLLDNDAAPSSRVLTGAPGCDRPARPHAAARGAAGAGRDAGGTCACTPPRRSRPSAGTTWPFALVGLLGTALLGCIAADRDRARTADCRRGAAAHRRTGAAQRRTAGRGGRTTAYRGRAAREPAAAAQHPRPRADRGGLHRHQRPHPRGESETARDARHARRPSGRPHTSPTCCTPTIARPRRRPASACCPARCRWRAGGCAA